LRWPLRGWRLGITATDYCRTACCISSSLNGVQLGMLLFLLAASFTLPSASWIWSIWRKTPRFYDERGCGVADHPVTVAAAL